MTSRSDSWTLGLLAASFLPALVLAVASFFSGPDPEALVIATPNAELLFGSMGDDTVYAGDGDDFIDGRSGADYLQGDAGSDIVLGGPGDDFLYGDSGDDRIYGGPGNDWVDGTDGDDVLSGGSGNDNYIGGEGYDIAKFDKPQAAYTITYLPEYSDWLRVRSGDETDEVIEVEAIRFLDGVEKIADLMRDGKIGVEEALDGVPSLPMGRISSPSR